MTAALPAEPALPAGDIRHDEAIGLAAEIIRIDSTRQLLLIKGALPGSRGGDIVVRPTVRATRAVQPPRVQPSGSRSGSGWGSNRPPRAVATYVARSAGRAAR